MKVYLVVWSGGYELPQYELFSLRSGAVNRAKEWATEAEADVDTIDVLVIDPDTMQIDRIEAE